jgi:hypothetical protein
MAKPERFIPAALLNQPLTRGTRLAEKMAPQANVFNRIPDQRWGAESEENVSYRSLGSLLAGRERGPLSPMTGSSIARSASCTCVLNRSIFDGLDEQ